MVTTDRPFELRYSGANQVIEQGDLFGRWVKKSLNLPEPCLSIKPEVVLNYVGNLLHLIATQSAPVHINMPFRAPLEPQISLDQGWLDYRQRAITVVEKRKSFDPFFTKYSESFEHFDFTGFARPLVIVGQIDDGWPLLEQWQAFTEIDVPKYFDASSSLRGQPSLGSIESDEFDRFIDGYQPDLVVHLGRRIVSQKLDRLLAQGFEGAYVVVNGSTEWSDPSHCCRYHIRGSQKAFVKAFTDYFRSPISGSMGVGVGINDRSVLSMDAVIESVWETIPKHAGLFLGNSSVIRRFERVATSRKSAVVPTFANRGVSGIEGHIATPIGIAEGLRSPVVAIVGDVSFYYDVSSLELLSSCPYPLVFMVCNDNGGGIFKNLPIGEFSEVLNPYLITPHQRSFSNLASFYDDLQFRQIKSMTELQPIVREALTLEKHTIVECLIK